MLVCRSLMFRCLPYKPHNINLVKLLQRTVSGCQNLNVKWGRRNTFKLIWPWPYESGWLTNPYKLCLSDQFSSLLEISGLNNAFCCFSRERFYETAGAWQYMLFCHLGEHQHSWLQYGSLLPQCNVFHWKIRYKYREFFTSSMSNKLASSWLV